MLKAAAKAQQAKLVHQQARSITSHYVYSSSDIRSRARRDILDTYAKVNRFVGYIKMNREHRYNTLTPNYIKSVSRSIETLNQDNNVKVIYLTSAKGEHFSNGTDFRTLLHYKNAEKSQEKINQYLKDLYELQIQAAKVNKPLITVAPGHAFNSGATFLQAAALPTTTLDTKMCFNEATFGFVPHGGSSYYLSRLPGEIGTFLALTGLPITGIDAKEFGISDQLVHYSTYYEEEVSDFLTALDFPIPNIVQMTNLNRSNQTHTNLKKRQEHGYNTGLDDLIEVHRKKRKNFFGEEFIEPKDNQASVNAQSDFEYKKMLQQYNERYEHHESYLEGRQALYQNYFKYILDYVKTHSGHEYPKDPKTFLRHVDIINRCFYANSLEQIIDNLQKEGDSPFAKICLERMQANSELSMKLALKLLRDAKILDYKGALQNELNVGLNKIQDSEFDLGVSEVLLKPHRHNSVFKNPGFQKHISNDQVLSYFQPNKWAKEIELGVVEKAMLPTRFYYETFSDQVRLWINEETTPQPEVREQFNRELQEALREKGIDIRDRALTLKDARSALYSQEFFKRRQKEFEKQLNLLVKDDKLRARYFNDAMEVVQHLEQDSGKYYATVNTKIQQIFENAYLEKLAMVFDKSVQAQNLEKRRMFIKFKKFLFQSRIITFANQEAERTFNILKNMPFKLPHLREKWDGEKSFREMHHPELERSWLFQLSKVVGKRSLAPPEMAKEYLTNPNKPSQLTLFTFDKDQLLKLRTDVLQRPEYYEKLFRKDNGTFNTGVTLTDGEFLTQQVKDGAYEYWYRVLNEGHFQQDSLPYYKELLAYKDFMSEVETKGLETLRLTVQRLLLDFDYQDGVNEVHNFAKTKTESKNQALTRLIALVNQLPEESSTASVGKKGKAKPTEGTLTQKVRALKDIKTQVSSLLRSDPEISKYIPSIAESAQNGNSLISSFKEKVFDELCQTIEFVLLNNNPKNKHISQNLLQERLAGLSNPSNGQQKNITNLRMLDAYLNDKNSENLIKNALRVAKPFFFANLRSKLDAEAQKVFDSFHIEATSQDVLFFYLFNNSHPEVVHAPITQKILKYNENQERQKYLDSLMPDRSQHYALKKFTSLLGEQYGIDPSLPLAEQEKILQENVKKEYDIIHQMKKTKQQEEQKYHEDAVKVREQVLTEPYESQNADNEVTVNPNFDAYKYEVQEINQILAYDQKADQLHEWMEEHVDEIRREIQNEEWLNVYATAIKAQNMDFRSALRYNTFDYSNEEEGLDFHLEFMREQFGGNSKLEWDDVAEYAGFLSGLYDQGYEAFSTKQGKENFNIVYDYLLKQIEIIDGDKLVKSESAYEVLRDTKRSLNQIGAERASFRADLENFSKLQAKIQGNLTSKANIKVLAQHAPQEIQEEVQAMLDSHSQYISYKKLEQLLLEKRYQEVSAAKLVDKKALMRDIKNGKALKQFMDNYRNTKLDVVSLAEAREVVNNAPSTNIFDKRLQQQVLLVLDYVEGSLNAVPHQRRAQISLGDYLHRHHYVNAQAVEEFADDILKKKIEEIMGKTLDSDAAEVIDWEYAGIRTQPIIHTEQDKKVKEALAAKGGVDDMEAIAEYLDQHLKPSSQAAQTLGEHEIIEEFVNEETGRAEMGSADQIELNNLLRDATRLTELRPEFTYIKNQFENDVLKTYSAAEFDPRKLETLIQRYTELRMKDCMLNKEFAKKVRSNNGHYYLKMLREKIQDELKLSEPAQASDFAFAKLENDPQFKLDVEGRYNFSDQNNLNSLGYDNLEKKVEGKHQEEMLDRLLQDYFLQKRGQYVATNELIDALNKQFDKRQFPDGHPYKNSDPKQINPDLFPAQGTPSFAFAALKQNLMKDLPEIVPQDYTEMMELDIATTQALNKNKSGLSERLRNQFQMDVLDLPEYFQLYDARKPPKQYVDEKLTNILTEIFDARRKVEKTLSRNELLAYDRVLINYLTKDVIIPRLKLEMNADVNTLIQLKQGLERTLEGKHDEEKQYIKSANTQREFNKSIKNEDALFKFFAYSAMLEKKRRENIDKVKKDYAIVYGLMTFEEYYKKQLQTDAKKEPREINPEHFKPKRTFDQNTISEGFKTTEEREADYFREFELFNESKKEQLERIQAFYILEQFFNKAKSNPDPMDKAQEAIKDYFSDPNNTFFFDRNKIQ